MEYDDDAQPRIDATPEEARALYLLECGVYQPQPLAHALLARASELAEETQRVVEVYVPGSETPALEIGPFREVD